MISFDNTENAFAYKTDPELKSAKFVFSIMRRSWLVTVGLKILPSFIKWHIPFTKTIIRSTIFKQFVGGETLQQTAKVVNKLERYYVQVILDYGVEGGKKGETGYDHVAKEFIQTIQYAATQSNIPFISIKVTSLARFGLLKKINHLMEAGAGNLASRYSIALQELSIAEKAEWDMVNNRMNSICLCAQNNKIKILIDAEESWIQGPIDYLAYSMMALINKKNVIVYTTVQLYRIDRFKFMEARIKDAIESNFIFGVKIVRGAYMEKERERARQMHYPSPIQPDKETCDKVYNEAIQFCMQHPTTVSLIVASHNEQSCLFAANLNSKDTVHFSQLYGMSDTITFNLAKAGYSVSKYLPFGPIREVIPYLMRRAQENSSVNEQTGRELRLTKKEIKRRKLNKE